MKIPHLVQYQGSKRNIAPEIFRFFPKKIDRIIEPFCGTAAISIYASAHRQVDSFLLNDINGPLVDMLNLCVNDPERLYYEYKKIWENQFLDDVDSLQYFSQQRDMFNSSPTPALMLFMLARVVKGAVRYNSKGQMNQSCDKRRYGTQPEKIRENALMISSLLKGKTEFTSLDYRDILSQAQPGDLVYMDPPYQGTSNTRDDRYFQGVDYQEFVLALSELNRRGIDYIVSYDDSTGDKKHGEALPEYLDLFRLRINAGTSSQSVLLGKNEITYESLYLSHGLKEIYEYWRKIEMGEIPDEFRAKLNSVTNKRAKFVIDTILQKGYCSTEDLKDAGYEHAPRAARDVRELGIPLDTFKVKDRSGKSIAAYRFGDWDERKKQNQLSKSSGRTQLSNKLKQALIKKYGCICFLYGEEYPERLLQVDHRIPYEILGEQDETTLSNFMLLCPSGNRAKSWACEHCKNWSEKNAHMCSECYYAHPENYSHIAGSVEKRIDVIFKSDEDIRTYDEIKRLTELHGISLQDAFKKYFSK